MMCKCDGGDADNAHIHTLPANTMANTHLWTLATP